MNPLMLILMIFEALISVCGLAFGVYCIINSLHILGPMIGFGSFAIFALFTFGMYFQARKKPKKHA